MAARLQGIDLQPQSAYLQHMDWDKLQYFLSVAHHGTLARAAQAMNVDPTTVSRRVTSLEADLQPTLFERAPAGFVLNAAGRAILSTAAEIAAGGARCHKWGRGSGLEGPLRIKHGRAEGRVTAGQYMVN